jgi:hypothetical protein
MNRLLSSGPARASLRLAVLVLGFALLWAAPAQARRLALVIGNDNYQQVSRLDKALNDAEGMALALNAAGFEVFKHRDLSFRKTVLAFEEFYDKIKGGDEVVVFYAGHGVQTDRGSYLLPVDIEGETQSQIEKISYSVNGLLEELDRIKARFSLIIVDACRDNPLRSRGRTIGISRGLSAPDVAKGQMVIFSAGRNQKALDALNSKDENPNGVFTRELLARMRTPGVSIEKLAIEVKNAVERSAATVNHDQRPLIVNDSTGEFFFFPVAGSASDFATAPAAAPSMPSEAAREDRFWEDAKAPDNAAGYEAYLTLYPTGRYAGLAKAHLNRLQGRGGGAAGTQVASSRNASSSDAPAAGLAPAIATSPSGNADNAPARPASPFPGVTTPAPASPAAEPPVPAIVAPPAAPSKAAEPEPPASSTPAPAPGVKGQASYTLANGDRYEGEVVGNTRSGQGIYRFANGDRYEGGFVDGDFKGKGVMAFANGDRYEGNFIGTVKQGTGVMQFANKDRYEGEFVDNEFHGKGTFVFANGERYTGSFVKGLRDGRGAYTFASGDSFEGTYVKGVIQGPGLYRFANGDRYEGNFVDGLFSGQGKLFLASGDRYEGEFRNNLKHGTGIHFFANKDRFEGQFKDGAQSGQGTHFFASGDSYSGEFANGVRHGKGTYRFASGQTREIEYVAGAEKAP